MPDNQNEIKRTFFVTATISVILWQKDNTWLASCKDMDAFTGEGANETEAMADLQNNLNGWLTKIVATGLFKKSSLLDKIWNHFKEMSLFEIGQHFHENDPENGLKNYITYLTLNSISFRVAYYHAAAVRAFHKLNPAFREKIKLMKLAALAQLPQQEIDLILAEHRTSFYSTEELLAATVRQTRDSVKLFKHEGTDQFLAKAALKNN